MSPYLIMGISAFVFICFITWFVISANKEAKKGGFSTK